MREDFNAPLGVTPQPPATPDVRRRASLAAAVACAIVAIVAARSYVRWPGGPAVAVSVPIESAPAAASAPEAPHPAQAASAAAIRTAPPATDPETTGTVKVVRGGGAEQAGALIIDVGQALGNRLTPAPDKRLVQKSKDGLLPQVGADGARAVEVYARPMIVSDKLKRSGPKLALFVGGVGLDDATAQTAIRKLPSAVTLGLAPYGSDLGRVAADARDAGHEIWLQAPMEGFGAGQNPGPHTLLAAGTAADNIDSLHWQMGRFVGYVGVANYLGGRFTADSQALTPVLKDIADRGLGFLDDGTSARSLVPDVAASLKLPLARADIDLDAERANQSLEAALIKAEALARKQGTAIVVATALPDNLDAIARFARELEGRGVALAPVSALLNRSAATASAGDK